MAASIDDILTAMQHIVTALNATNQNNTTLAGAQAFFNITTPTIIKTGPGRLVNLVLVVAGSADGSVYDAQTVSDTTRKIYPILHSGSTVQIANQPFQYGLLISPGTGQTIAGSYRFFSR